MPKYLFIIFICFNTFYPKSIFSKFIFENQVFLESPIQYISFDYSTKNIDGLSETGMGKLLLAKIDIKLF